MARPPSPSQVAWFARWLGVSGPRPSLPTGFDAAVAMLHPGTRAMAVADDPGPSYVGPLRGDLAPEQKRLLSRLLMALADPRASATLASWDATPHLRPQAPMDVATRVEADLDYLLVAGRVSSLVWTTWEPRFTVPQPVTALWPDDREWCVWTDPRRPYTVLAGSEELCDRVREAPVLAAAPLPTR
ncbi:hypothetical protein [uncultured Nocardioides sp.]|uniref:hypothetical protein n=1 Tax=uncultured Nocardioides sp. TaxID=198441 RepID=UPI00262F3576|nr:hypothetical protein [uncultured Nocardioides sp.]